MAEPSVATYRATYIYAVVLLALLDLGVPHFVRCHLIAASETDDEVPAVDKDHGLRLLEAYATCIQLIIVHCI